MKLIFTEQAVESLEESLEFISTKVSSEKLLQIRDQILNSTDILLKSPKIGQPEEYLEHLNLRHRRLIEGSYKIIYRIEKQAIFITDIFDTRQNPKKMKG